MRLLSKIASAVLLGIVMLLVIDGYLSVRREVELFDNDMARDSILIGNTLKPLVAEAWSGGGDAAARELIAEANRQESEVEIRWVRLDTSPATGNAPRVPAAMLDSLTIAHNLSFKLEKGEAAGNRYTNIHVPVADGDRALELTESLSVLRAYTRSTVLRKVFLGAALLAVSWVILWILGIRFVGWPLDQLVRKTHRVGAGDFSGDVIIRGRDELTRLAAAMNEMCRELEATRIAIRAEAEARMEAMEQLRHSERLAMLGRLSSGIAHELGTPLNVVAGRAQLIATEDLARDKVLAYSKTIEEQAHRMTAIIRQLLDFAHQRPSQREPTDLAPLCTQIIDLLAPTAERAEVSLQLDAVDILPRVSADRSHLQQVLMNLIMNGIQAMPDGGQITIRLGTSRTRHRGVSSGPERDYVTITVEDRGVGMSEEQIKMIFDPFFTTKELGKGTGLGLSIAHGIVEEHDGWIGVTSKPGVGSSFVLYLPMEDSS